MPEAGARFTDDPMALSQRAGLIMCQRLLARGSGPQEVSAAKDISTRWLSTAAPVNSIDGKVMHPDLLNDNLKKTQYAVRGELYLRAEQLRKEGKDIIFTNGTKNLPLLTYGRIGNLTHSFRHSGQPTGLGRKACDVRPPGAPSRYLPSRYQRTNLRHGFKVLALVAAPFLLENPSVGKLFPKDAIARAQRVLAAFQGGVGAYSDSRGNPMVREDVAHFISERDGLTADPDVRMTAPSAAIAAPVKHAMSTQEIFLTDGASVSVRMCLNALIRDHNDGILVPVPQYPLYSASIQLYGKLWRLSHSSASQHFRLTHAHSHLLLSILQLVSTQQHVADRPADCIACMPCLPVRPPLTLKPLSHPSHQAAPWCRTTCKRSRTGA